MIVEPPTYVSKLKEILDELDRQELKFASEDGRLAVALGILGEISRDRRMAVIQRAREEEHRKIEPSRTWRDEPATLTQMEFLDRYEIPHTKPITKGQASDLIERKIEEWKGKG